MDTLSIYKSIYNDVFCKTFNQTCYVFLCGGANKDNIRNQTRVILEKKQLTFIIEDEDGEIFGYYYNTEIIEDYGLAAYTDSKKVKEAAEKYDKQTVKKTKTSVVSSERSEISDVNSEVVEFDALNMYIIHEVKKTNNSICAFK